MAQDGGDVAVGRIGEPQQPMLDLDIVVGARQGQPGRRSERSPAGLVETAHKRFQSDGRHHLLPIVNWPDRRRRSVFNRQRKRMFCANALSSMMVGGPGPNSRADKCRQDATGRWEWTT